jgi:hypothetical protein
MRKKWIAINLLLLLAVGFLAWQLNYSVLRFNNSNNPSQLRPIMKPQKAPPAAPAQPANATMNPAEFSAIPEKNLFSESRSREEKVDVPVTVESPPLTAANRPILVGTMIMGSQKLASVIDPTNQKGKPQTKRIGDVMSGYTLTEINPDGMILESGTRREHIGLREGIKKPSGGKTPILATRIVPFGGGGGGAAASTGAVPPGMGTGSVTIIPAGGAAARGSSPVASGVYVAGQPGASRGATTQTRPGTTPGQPTTAPQQIIISPGRGNAPANRAVIPTPLGDIIRPIP